LPVAERKLIDIAELKNVRDIENGNRALGSEVEGVLNGQRGPIGGAAAEEHIAVVGGRGIVDRLRPCVGSKKLQTIGELALQADLKSVIHGVRDRRRVSRKTGELRERDVDRLIGTLERRNRLRRERNCRITDKARRIARAAGTWIEEERVGYRVEQVASLRGRQLEDLLSEEVVVSETAQIEMRSLFPDVAGIEQNFFR